MKESWKTEYSGKRDLYWNLYWCELSPDIDSAEADLVITSEQV